MSRADFTCIRARQGIAYKTGAVFVRFPKNAGFSRASPTECLQLGRDQIKKKTALQKQLSFLRCPLSLFFLLFFLSMLFYVTALQSVCKQSCGGVHTKFPWPRQPQQAMVLFYFRLRLHGLWAGVSPPITVNKNKHSSSIAKTVTEWQCRGDCPLTTSG